MLKEWVNLLRNDWCFILLISALSLFLRIDLQYASNFTIDSDEAIVGLMGKHILEGKGIPVFYYGQHYMGSLEPLCAAVVFAIFGISSVSLKAVPLCWSVMLIPLVYLLGAELAGTLFNKDHFKRLFSARIATLLIGVSPSPLMVWSGMARGGFIEIVVLSTISLLIAMHIVKSSALLPNKYRVFCLGLVLGFGWWTNNQIVFAIVAIFFGYTLWILRFYPSLINILKVSLVGVVGFFIGSSPFWWYNFKNSFASFGIFQPTVSVTSHIKGFLSVALPTILGARRFWHEDSLFIGASFFAYTFFIVLLFRFIFICLERYKKDSYTLPQILISGLFLFCTFAIFILSSFGSLVQAPRYLLPLYPILAVIYGCALASFYIKRWLIILGTLSLILFNLCSSYYGGRATPGEPHVFRGERVARDNYDLINWLANNQITAIRTNYWIGYRLAFETNEAIRFGIFDEPSQIRIADYQKITEALPLSAVPLVLTKLQGKIVQKGLTALGATFIEQKVGEYSVISKIDLPKVGYSERVPVETTDASHNPQELYKATDGNNETRWGSSAPQSSDMFVVFGWSKPKKLYGLSINYGRWHTDAARGLVISCEIDGKSTNLLSHEDYPAVHYVQTNLSRGSLRSVNFAFNDHPQCLAIRLRQVSKDSIFDWSIAEIDIYGE